MSSLERWLFRVSFIERFHTIQCTWLQDASGSGIVEHTVISFRLAVYIRMCMAVCMPNWCCELLSGGAAVV